MKTIFHRTNGKLLRHWEQENKSAETRATHEFEKKV